MIKISEKKELNALIDTHCHVNMIVKNKHDVLLSKNEVEQGKVVLEEAALNNVTCVINVGTSLVESENVIELARRYEQYYAVVGIHPTDAQQATLNDVTLLKQRFFKSDIARKIVGIGECGFDFYHQGLSRQKQEDFFVAQIELALEFDRAIVVHSRNAYDETLEVLERYKTNNLRAVIHCFSYDQQFANIVVSWGFYLGIGGTITYPKNQQLRELVQQVSLESIVLETDAPFLPIQLMRGKMNHPKYIKDIAAYIALLKKCNVEHISNVTTENAKELFLLS